MLLNLLRAVHGCALMCIPDGSKKNKVFSKYMLSSPGQRISKTKTISSLLPSVDTLMTCTLILGLISTPSEYGFA